MLDIPPIKLRVNLIRFMVEKYQPATNKYILDQGQISVSGVDVECLLGITDDGLVIADILYEEGNDAKKQIPPHFVSKNTGNLLIEDLIVDVIKDNVADDDFIRKAVLVLLGTVLAPSS
jgi:hypothetical protein